MTAKKMVCTGSIFLLLIAAIAALFFIQIYNTPLILWVVAGLLASGVSFILISFLLAVASDICDFLNDWWVN